MTDQAATERVGRYQLLEPIGTGPTGSVARGKVFGVAGFERQFAIKRFLPEVAATGPAAQALSAAARAYGSLEHPRIARMSEFGVSQGTTFTAVELVAGIDALRLATEARLAGAHLAAGGALALVSQAARAIGYAHGRGISHLGLAPTNVIVTADGDIKITDFGVLAATLPARPVDVPRLAQRMPYLAPEQIAGEATSAATDVFSLGVLAYELVSGQRAFKGDTPAQIAQAIVAGPPPELALPRPIVRVLQRCLARSPFERFPDARALADALDAALRVAPVPGSRKDIGALVKELVERLATLNEGQMSGMLSLNVGTGPIRRADSNDLLSRIEDEGPETESFLRPDTEVAGPTPLVGPARPGSALEVGPGGTQPDLPRPITTMTGLAPPPIPVPQGVTGPPPIPSIPMPGFGSTTIPGVARERPGSSPPLAPAQMQIPTIRPRGAAGSTGIPPIKPPPIPRPNTPLVEAVTAALSDDEPVRGPLFAPSELADEVIERGRSRPAEQPPPAPPPAIGSRTIMGHAPMIAPVIAPVRSTPAHDKQTSDMPPLLVDRLKTAAKVPTDQIAAELDDAYQIEVTAAPGPNDSTDPVDALLDSLDEPQEETVPERVPQPRAARVSTEDFLRPGRTTTEDFDSKTGAKPIEMTSNESAVMNAMAPIVPVAPRAPSSPSRSPTPPAMRATTPPAMRATTPPPTPTPTPMPMPVARVSATLSPPTSPVLAPKPAGPAPMYLDGPPAVIAPSRAKWPWLVVVLLVACAGGAVGAWQAGMFDGDGGGDDGGGGGSDVAVTPPAKPIDAGAAIARVDAALVAVAAIDAGSGSAKAALDAGAGSAVVAPIDAGSAVVAAIDAGAGSGGGSGSATPQVAVQVTPGSDLAIASTPAAHAFLDGADQNTTPMKLAGTTAQHTVVLYAPGYDLYVAKLDGHGSFNVTLTPVPPTKGDAGIKVIHCKDKDRYYVYVDGKPSGQTCPTENRINVDVGNHTVEVYDVQTDSRKHWDVQVVDTRLSLRVRVEP